MYPANVLTNSTYQKMSYVVSAGKDIQILPGDKLNLVITYTQRIKTGRGIITWYDALGCVIDGQESASFSKCTFVSTDAALAMTIDNSGGTTTIAIPNWKGISALVSQTTTLSENLQRYFK